MVNIYIAEHIDTQIKMSLSSLEKLNSGSNLILLSSHQVNNTATSTVGRRSDQVKAYEDISLLFNLNYYNTLFKSYI